VHHRAREPRRQRIALPTKSQAPIDRLASPLQEGPHAFTQLQRPALLAAGSVLLVAASPTAADRRLVPGFLMAPALIALPHGVSAQIAQADDPCYQELSAWGDLSILTEVSYTDAGAEANAQLERI
jgi:hypothetical protein